MATRFYFPSSGAPPVSPAYDTNWDDTTIGDRRNLVTSKSSTAVLSRQFTDTDSTDKDILYRQYVSAQLAEQTISAQTISFVISAIESSGSNNLYLAISIRSWNGSTFQTLLSLTRDDTEIESAYYCSRILTASTTSIDVAEGDRLVVEIGVGGDPNPSGSHDSYLRVGDNYFDLDASDTDTGTQDVGWIEFPNTISFSSSSDKTVSVSDGLTVGESTALTVSSLEIDISDGLVVGESQDVDVSEIDLNVKPPTVLTGTLINIDHETGDLSQYTSVVDPDVGEINATEGSAQADTNYGLAITINDQDNVYGVKDLVTSSTTGIVRVRFYIDPSNVTMGTGHRFDILSLHQSSTSYFASLSLYYTGSAYQLRASIVDDIPTAYNTSDYTILTGENYIELQVTRASGESSNDGTLSLWINGVLKETISGKDNYDRFLNFDLLRIGAVSSLDVGTSGTLYLDELLVLDNSKTIGPLNYGDSITVGESVAVSIGLNVNPPRIATGIIDIDHEVGDFSEYYSHTSDADFTVSTDAGLAGTTYGLDTDINDTDMLYARAVVSSNTSGIWRVRCYLDPNGINIGSATTRLYVLSMAGVGGQFAYLCLGYDSGYYVSGVGNPDSVSFSKHAISDSPHCIELEVKRASGSGIADGTCRLFIDGISVETIYVSNYTIAQDYQYTDVGNILPESLVSGIFFLDEIVVNDTGAVIGPKSDTGDAVAVGELRYVTVSDIAINVTDNLTIGESTDITGLEVVNLDVNEQDDIIVGESITVKTSDLDIDELDAVAVGESRAIIVSSLEINVTDGLAVGDIDQVPALACSIDVTDGLVTEDTPEVSIEALGDLSPSGQDDLTIGEDILIGISDLIIVSQDDLAVGEDVNISLADLSLSVSDGIVLGDTGTVSVSALEIVCSNGLSLDDIANVSVLGAEEITISKQDDLTVDDSIDVESKECYASVSDGVALGDTAVAAVSDLNLTVSDGLAVSDDPLVQVEILAIDTQDSVAVSDQATFVVSSCVLSATDIVTLGESTEAEIGLSPTASDSVTVEDQVSLEVTALILEATDDVVLSDVPSISLPEPGALVIYTSDDVAIGETTTVLVSGLVAIVSDGCVVGEVINVVFQVEDLVVAITPETTWATGVRIYP